MAHDPSSPNKIYYLKVCALADTIKQSWVAFTIPTSHSSVYVSDTGLAPTFNVTTAAKQEKKNTGPLGQIVTNNTLINC